MGTVQRPGDWIDFCSRDYDGENLVLRQNKTDKPLILPCTRQLKAALDSERSRLGATPIAARPILITQGGGSMSYRYMAQIML